MARALRYSRWKRIPGLHRITERRLSDHRSEAQRLTLYLPGSVLDTAELLAARAGSSSVQEYCEGLLSRVVEAEAARERVEKVEAARAPMEGLDEIASDLDYLAEWTARARAPQAHAMQPSLEDGARKVDPLIEQSLPATTEAPPELAGGGTDEPPAACYAAQAVIRHAAPGTEDVGAFLPTLRRGEPIPPGTATDLLQALVDLENELRGGDAIERRLAYALHRLAFEGQVLLTDAWPSLASDQATVDVLRMVQEAVDRVLSGEDIRYFAGPVSGEELP